MFIFGTDAHGYARSLLDQGEGIGRVLAAVGATGDRYPAVYGQTLDALRGRRLAMLAAVKTPDYVPDTAAYVQARAEALGVGE